MSCCFCFLFFKKKKSADPIETLFEARSFDITPNISEKENLYIIYTRLNNVLLFSLFKIKQSRSTAQNLVPLAFTVCSSRLLPKYIETESADYLLLLHIKLFKKIKKTSGTSRPPLFNGMFFEEKYYSRYILLTEQITLSDCLYFLRYCVYYNLLPRRWHDKFLN